MPANQFEQFMLYLESNEELKKEVEAVLKEYAGAKLHASSCIEMVRPDPFK